MPLFTSSKVSVKPKVLVLGASDKPERYSYRAIKKLLAHGFEVVAVGSRCRPDFSVPILTSIPANEQPDTVCLYLNPERQKAYEALLIALHPRRIIFNPGTENPVFAHLAQQNGIQTVEDCTLVMLAGGTF